MPENTPSLAVSFIDQKKADTAQEIATKLHVELTTSPLEYHFILMIQTTHFELIDTTNKSKPFFIDFNSGKLTYRRHHGGGRGQAICRAIGLKGNTSPRVIDGTAGLGRDSFVLASLGCTITMFERNPILQILLQDGLKRGCTHPETKEICTRMQLVTQDLHDFTCKKSLADVIYLDPMYPHRKKSSLVKKEMRIIRQLVGDDLDADQLLPYALETGIKRIVVKRPKNAPFLGNKKPTTCLKEKNSRFDIYLQP